MARKEAAAAMPACSQAASFDADEAAFFAAG
jgi:hypothetical protein